MFAVVNDPAVKFGLEKSTCNYRGAGLSLEEEGVVWFIVNLIVG